MRVSTTGVDVLPRSGHRERAIESGDSSSPHPDTGDLRSTSPAGGVGFIAGRDRIARLRRELGLGCRQKRKFFKATTHSAHTLPMAESVLDQVFEPTRPNEVWTGDITYIPTDEGWLYLAGLKNVFTCEIVGYAMAERMTSELVSLALFRAVQYKRPSPGLIQHTDRGSQYCAKAYRGLQSSSAW